MLVGAAGRYCAIPLRDACAGLPGDGPLRGGARHSSVGVDLGLQLGEAELQAPLIESVHLDLQHAANRAGQDLNVRVAPVLKRPVGDGHSSSVVLDHQTGVQVVEVGAGRRSQGREVVP